MNNAQAPPPKTRRKSSSFRPSTFYPMNDSSHGSTVSPSLTTNRLTPLSLEDLPTQVLVQIFSNLQTKDLMALGVASKLLYIPAMIQLYCKIIISPSVQSIQMSRTHLQHLHFNYGTLISIASVPKLTRVLMEQRKLAMYVRSMTFLHSIDWDETVGGVHAWSMDMTKTPVSAPLKAFLHPLLLKLNLTELYNPSWIFETLQFEYLTQLTVSINSIKSCSNDIHLPKLTHLKIYYHNDSNQQSFLEIFAQNLQKSGATTNLTTLEFEAPAKPSMKFINNSDLVIWITFFQNTKYMKLKSLALDGYLGDKSENIAYIISNSTDLLYLQNLQLNTTERSHQFEAHESGMVACTFLDTLTKKAPNIQQLAINPTLDCLSCQMQSIEKTLTRNIPNKLITLSIILDSPNLQTTRTIINAIVTSQLNLVNLRFHDKSQEVEMRNELIRYIKQDQVNLYEKSIYFDLLLKDNLYRSFFLYEIQSIAKNLSQAHNMIILNDLMVRFIQNNYQQLSNYLWQSQSNPSLIIHNIQNFIKLPHLQSLSIFGINLFLDHPNKCISFIMNDGCNYIKSKEL